MPTIQPDAPSCFGEHRTATPTQQLCTALMRCHQASNGELPQQTTRQGDGFTLSPEEPIPQYFAQIDYTVPMAQDMSASEIATAISDGIDPYAQPKAASLPRTTDTTLLFDLLCAVQLVAALDTADPNVSLFESGVTLITIPDNTLRIEVNSALKHVLPFYCMARGIQSDDLHVIKYEASSQPSKSAGVDMFRKKLDVALSENPSVLAIASSTSDLSEAGQMLLNCDVAWPQLSQSILMDLLRVTHSTTGQVADAELRKRLPSDVVLARLPWPIIVHALRASTTLEVADRLASLKTVQEPVSGPTLKDVHGLPTVVSGLQHLVEDINAWKSGKLDWPDVSSSILFHGPPGTGKTLIAEALSNSADATFISTSYADCQKAGHLGDYLKAMSEKVERAIAEAPSIFFIDELYSYQNRTSMDGRNSNYMRSVVNGLLEQLTRLNATPGVVIVAATNDIKNIDAALIRAGRFDQKIPIRMPDKTGVDAILLSHLGKPELNLGALSLQLVGMSGAEIAAVAQDAKGEARRERKALTIDHVRTAIRRRLPATSDALMHRKAIHEAGHAVTAHALCLAPGKRLYLSGHGGGYDAPRADTLTYKTAEAELAMILAGRAAERLILGSASSGAGGGAQSDLAQATELAFEMEYSFGLGPSLYFALSGKIDPMTVPDDVKDRIENVLQRASKLADHTLKSNRTTLLRVANALLMHRELDAAQLKAVLSEASTDNAKPDARSADV